MRVRIINHNSVRLLLIIAAALLLLEGLGKGEMLQVDRDANPKRISVSTLYCISRIDLRGFLAV